MVTQSISDSRRLSNVVLAGVVFTICSVIAGSMWLVYSTKNVVDMRAEYVNLKDSVNSLRGLDVRPVLAKAEPAKSEPLVVANPVAEKKVENTPVLPVAKDTAPAVKKPVEKPSVVAATTQPVIQPVVQKEKPAVKSEKLVANKGIVLTYYTRRADNQNLKPTLETTGYNFEEKKLEKNTGYQKTNCIWYGAGVPLSAVKKVAIAMIQSGNPVKGIKRFPQSLKNASYKRNVIEVGMEVNYENYYSRPLSIIEIERAKGFH